MISIWKDRNPFFLLAILVSVFEQFLKRVVEGLKSFALVEFKYLYFY
jgi:hypothetical protein